MKNKESCFCFLFQNSYQNINYLFYLFIKTFLKWFIYLLTFPFFFIFLFCNKVGEIIDSSGRPRHLSTIPLKNFHLFKIAESVINFYF